LGYQTLYREWRPATFAEVSGQEHIKRTLSNMLQSARVPHALLFAGPRGTGKTTMAKIMARALNCHTGITAEPCLVCPACVGVAGGTSLDVLEIDAASNRGIDEIRELREHVKFSPTELRTKVYIIDEVHMLTTEAFNALLKTLEEPPRHVVFILATTEPHKLPATIISRCQRFDFRRISSHEVVDRLTKIAASKGVPLAVAAAQELAQHAGGCMRDALGLLEQCMAYADGEVSLDTVLAVTGTVPSSVYTKLLLALAQGDIAEGLRQLNSELSGGRETSQYVSSYISTLRLLLLAAHSPRVLDETGYDGELRQSFLQLAEKIQSFLPAVIDIALQTEIDMRYGGHPRLHVELMLVKQGRAMRGMPQGLPVGPEPVSAVVPSESPPQEAPKVSRPEVQVPPAASAQEIATLLKAWPDVQRVVKQKAPLTGATMGAISPLRMEKDTVILQMNEPNIHTFKRLSQPVDLGHIAKAFSQVLGKPVDVRLIMTDGSGAPVSAASASESHITQVMEIFQGTIVKDKQ